MTESSEWQDLVQRQPIDDCLVRHFLIENFVIGCYQVTDLFGSGLLLRQCVFCKEFSKLWFASIVRNFGLSGSKDNVLLRLWCNCRRTFRTWVLRNVCGHVLFCVLKIICKLLQPKRSSASRLPFFIYFADFLCPNLPVSLRHFVLCLDLWMTSRVKTMLKMNLY